MANRQCRFCCCCFLGALISLILLVGIAGGVFYAVFHPKSPSYSIDSISIKNFNVSSSPSSPISPEFDVTVRAYNPNDGIYYLTGSSVAVFHKHAELSSGPLPVFLQGKNNLTVFTAALKGTTGATRGGLAGGGAVQLRVAMRVPLKIKAGSRKSWKMIFKVECRVTVDKLTVDAKIVSKKCSQCFSLIPQLEFLNCHL